MDDPETTEATVPFQVTYRNKAIRNYHAGKFAFENGLMTLYSEQDNEEWLAFVKTLPTVETTAIVEYHPEKLAEIETPMGVVKNQVVTSAMITDTKVQAPAGSGMSALFNKN